MEEVICGQCEEVIKDTGETYYSLYLTEYFCDIDCATLRAFEEMRMTSIDLGSNRNKEVHFKNNILYYK
ncbi:hypothetical protein BSK59_13550 [Paenibacillus odorifer]|uniref:hypothetical protein n=1 Tax=Paenibacillus TaxID=44249 RepID=UPI00096D84AA|nr:hypothetical protein [Paenibacillus odorifer]OME55496.1 hypothetical protein BSK59_13550 [Paenibacillus odorifer]